MAIKGQNRIDISILIKPSQVSLTADRVNVSFTGSSLHSHVSVGKAHLSSDNPVRINLFICAERNCGVSQFAVYAGIRIKPAFFVSAQNIGAVR